MPRQSHVTPEWDARLRKAVEQGLTLGTLSERMGRPETTIRRALKRLGLKATPDKREPAEGL